MSEKYSKIKNYYPYAYLAIGFVFLFFSNGRWILPVASFISLLFLIRFLRYKKPFIGFLFVLLAGWISNIIIWREMMPGSGFFYYFLMLMMSVFTTLTLLIDRIYSQKVKGITSTLVFPSAYVIMEYIVVYTNPSGSYGTLAHTQTSLPLLQLLSITGIWGITFLITWTASIINWLWDNSFEKDQMKLALLVYGIPVFMLIIYGQSRIMVNDVNKTVRVASININKSSIKMRSDGLRDVFKKNDWSKYDSISNLDNDRFLNSCHTASASGAGIVFGIETIISLRHENESSFIEKAKQQARKDNIYLGLPTQVFLKGFPKTRPENKIIWISPQGEIISTYYKARPTPGEGKYGDGKLKYFDTPYGRICSSICFDMNFIDLIKQVSSKNIDIMLVPGFDWREITPYHTYVASFRAIEQGFNMVRSAAQGLSASFDYKGQLLSSMDFYKTGELILYSDIPVKGQKTIYKCLGDYFAWICILFFIFACFKFFRNKN